MNSSSTPNLSADEIIHWRKYCSLEELCTMAGEACRKEYGNAIWIRGLLETSNRCSCNCLYCGIRAANRQVRRYSMGKKEILETVRNAFAAGFRTFVLQSGEQREKNGELCSLVEKMREHIGTEGAITLSVGILSFEEYSDLKKAGADRYLLRFETSSPALHAYLRNGITLKERLRALYNLKELGYEVGSGYMVGLPGETEAIRTNNALLCKKLELDMVGLGPFLPHPQTPLGKTQPGKAAYVREATALVRLLLPRANIPATTATATLDNQLQAQLFAGGANVLMLNITPSCYRHSYALYPGKSTRANDLPLFSTVNDFVPPAGKKADFSRGNALSFNEKNQRIEVEKE